MISKRLDNMLGIRPIQKHGPVPGGPFTFWGGISRYVQGRNQSNLILSPRGLGFGVPVSIGFRRRGSSRDNCVWSGGGGDSAPAGP